MNALPKNHQLNVDTSWGGLTRPGDACNHFSSNPLPPFQPHAKAFNLTNAFWLSEISRLIYRRSGSETEEVPAGPSRADILKTVELRETLFLSRQETQCALVRTAPGHQDPFAALVFRGTTGLRNWFLDLDVRPQHIAPRTVVHRGFKEALDHVWKDLQPQLVRLRVPLFITGHSMGGALAQLAAWYHPPCGVYSFGAPRVGDTGFTAGMTRTPVYRLVNDRDVVTVLPPSSQLLSFKAAGELVHIDRGGRVCQMAGGGEAATCWESARMSMPASGGRWFNPPGFLADHAPINYSAKILKSLHSNPNENGLAVVDADRDRNNVRIRLSGSPTR